MFISLKQKNAILEMALKSFIISKLDHQMSKSWKRIVAHELQTSSKFDLLKKWVTDCSAQDRISAKNFLESKHVFKVYFKYSRKNPDFLLLPFSSLKLQQNCHLLHQIFWEIFRVTTTKQRSRKKNLARGNYLIACTIS